MDSVFAVLEVSTRGRTIPAIGRAFRTPIARWPAASATAPLLRVADLPAGLSTTRDPILKDLAIKAFGVFQARNRNRGRRDTGASRTPAHNLERPNKAIEDSRAPLHSAAIKAFARPLSNPLEEAHRNHTFPRPECPLLQEVDSVVAAEVVVGSAVVAAEVGSAVVEEAAAAGVVGAAAVITARALQSRSDQANLLAQTI